MTRTASRLATTLAAAAMVATLSACGSTNEVPSAGNPVTSADTTQAPGPDGAASSTKPAQRTETGPPTGVPVDEAPKPTTAEAIADRYLQQTLTDLYILNAPKRQDLLAALSAYLTDEYATALRDDPNNDKSNEGYWLAVAPWYVEGAYDGSGSPIITAEATITGVKAHKVTPTYQDVTVAADFTWTLENGQKFTGNRTLDLRMVPAADDSGYAWRIDGSYGEHSHRALD